MDHVRLHQKNELPLLSELNRYNLDEESKEVEAMKEDDFKGDSCTNSFWELN